MKTIKVLLPLLCLFLLFSCSKETETNVLENENKIELRNDDFLTCDQLSFNLVNTLTQTPDGCCIYRLDVSSTVAGSGVRVMTHRQSSGSTIEEFTSPNQSFEIIACADEVVGVAVVDRWGEVCFEDHIICDENECGSCENINASVTALGTYDDDNCCEYELTLESTTPGCGQQVLFHGQTKGLRVEYFTTTSETYQFSVCPNDVVNVGIMGWNSDEQSWTDQCFKETYLCN